MSNTAIKTPSELIDTKELCKRTKLSRGKIHLMVKDGEIPKIKIGTAVRFNWIAVLEALESPTAQ